MEQLKRTLLFLYLVSHVLQALGADKYTDENRPYEFGFSIDGEQHRHETKDKNGIIMGEFGFITADGVYHVTVYATDEQGRFKILSMKNIRVKPYPGTSAATVTSKATGVKKGHSLPFPPSQNIATTIEGQKPTKPPPPENIATTTESQKPEKDNIFSPAKSCSHCSIPTTTSKPRQSANVAYSMYTSTNTNNQGIENTFNSLALGIPQVSNSQGSIKTQSNQSHKPIQAGSELSSSQNYNGPNTAPNYQEPQSFNQNEQRFDQITSRQDSADLARVQQGVGNDVDNNNNILQNPYSDNNSQTPNTGFSNKQQLGKDQPIFQEPSYQRNPQNINDAQNYQQPKSLQNNDDSENARQYNDNTGPLVTNTYKANDSSNKQLGTTENHFLRSGFENQPEGEIGAQNYPQKSAIHDESNTENVVQYNSDIGNVGQYNDNPVTQAQNANIGSTNSQGFNNQEPQVPQGIISGDRIPKKFESFGQSQSGEIQKPTLVAAQMQIVDKNTDIHYKKPGEEEGLPNGITKGDMEHLLYTFNYTVGFHGHFEEGYTSGSKQGYYFVTGRNGIRTRIDYTADETGFHPKISQEVLDLLSDEVPKPETEKDEKYGLKGYEFKWLYYPVGSKR